jgi:hypothetical protein
MLRVETNSIHHSYIYVELFAGGTGMALALLIENYKKNTGYRVYSFRRSSINEINALCSFIIN